MPTKKRIKYSQLINGLAYEQWPDFLKTRLSPCLSRLEKFTEINERRRENEFWQLHIACSRCELGIGAYELIICQRESGRPMVGDLPERYAFSNGQTRYDVVPINIKRANTFGGSFILEPISPEHINYPIGEDLEGQVTYQTMMMTRLISDRELRVG